MSSRRARQRPEPSRPGPRIGRPLTPLPWHPRRYFTSGDSASPSGKGDASDAASSACTRGSGGSGANARSRHSSRHEPRPCAAHRARRRREQPRPHLPPASSRRHRRLRAVVWSSSFGIPCSCQIPGMSLIGDVRRSRRSRVFSSRWPPGPHTRSPAVQIEHEPAMNALPASGPGQRAPAPRWSAPASPGAPSRMRSSCSSRRANSAKPIPRAPRRWK